MLEKLNQADKELLLTLNQLNLPWLDPVMLFLTKTWAWIPLYALLIYLVIKVYKNRSWIPLAGTALTITLTDRLTSGLMKPYFARVRPSHNPELANMLHLVDGYKGGEFSFVSGHAANSFATALLVWLLLRNHYPATRWLFAWAAFMSYTRIYLGVHYPGDILAGALTGMACAATIYLGMKKSFSKVFTDYDSKPLLPKQ
ncbi:MAG: phosphatase PAP2 family protein [Cyclobacteriaceae bacterium]|nr:phosphatase PAP2 family protein [Cyclobacteriaceae bacterium]MCX7637635.1 phosphatase PAP2 family protein [Cyclobacteriaceae bacterium]MDW8331695.1 phosphatase PAP2 family protein [Cyclobacteriaceae bacterium]